MRIRFRLALYAASVTFISVSGFVILLLILGNASSVADHEQALTVAVESAVENFASVEFELLNGFVSPFVVDSPTSLDVFLVVADDVGSVEFSSGRVNGEVPHVPAAVIIETLGEGGSVAVSKDGLVELRMVARRWPDAWPGEGVLVAVQPTEFAEQQLRGLAAVLWIAGLITLIATTLVGWLVSGRAVRPLADLAETTDEIAATGDLTRRLPSVKANDEVGRLTTSFNAMLASLEKTRARLASSLDTQRQFVADASHELRSPLTTIRGQCRILDGPPRCNRGRSERGDR